MRSLSEQTLVAQLVDEALEGVSLSIVVPGTEDSVTEVRGAVTNELFRRNVDVAEVVAANSGGHVVRDAVEAFDYVWEDEGSPRTIQQLFSQGEYGRTLVINGATCRDDVDYSAWFGLMSDWGDCVRKARGLGVDPPSIIGVFSAALATELDVRDVFLRQHVWWGVPSSLEIQVKYRQPDGGDLLSIEDRWREAILPSLVSGDSSLIDPLWEVVLGSVDKLIDVLVREAELRGWTTDRLRSWGGERLRDATLSDGQQDRQPPSEFAMLWSTGALRRTPEHGMELHPCACAMLGLSDDVSHRMWRGQSRLLLPVLDAVRLSVCRQLTMSLGKDWPLRWQQPDSERERFELGKNSLSCGWGHIARLMRLRSEVRQACDVAELARVSAVVRNDLAHHRPITFRQCRILANQMADARRRHIPLHAEL